jgi:hypothetical protein
MKRFERIIEKIRACQKMEALIEEKRDSLKNRMSPEYEKATNLLKELWEFKEKHKDSLCFFDGNDELVAEFDIEEKILIARQKVLSAKEAYAYGLFLTVMLESERNI